VVSDPRGWAALVSGQVALFQNSAKARGCSQLLDAGDAMPHWPAVMKEEKKLVNMHA